MSFNTISDPDAVATVTVTFNPDMKLLSAQLRALPEISLKILVDNASKPAIAEKIQDLAARIPNTYLLSNPGNLGLAAAVNLGVRAVSELSPVTRFVLMLDQDSEPMANSILTLLEAFQRLEMDGNKVGCVGPVLQDPDTGLRHGFHQCTRWRWRRVYPAADSTAPIPCVNLNGSGTLMSVALFLQMDGLDESLFIDHVDTEWAFRVISAGYELWGIPNAVFIHRMGQASVRFWCLGWRIWPYRSPQRHYYLFRNAIILMRRQYVPGVWKAWAIGKLILTCIVHFFSDRARLEQIVAMFHGVRDGFLSRST
jgi:rhamnosyltransferase